MRNNLNAESSELVRQEIFLSYSLFLLDSETFMPRCPDQRHHDNRSVLD